jgi:hypothetical protein
MKNFFQNIFKRFGFELHRARGRGTLSGALEHLKEKGFRPEYVIDGGASDGRWSLEAQRYFPEAKYTLIDPIVEYIPSLKMVPNGTVVSKSLSKDGEITLDGVLKEPEKTLLKLDLDGVEIPILSASKKLSRVPAVILECAFFQIAELCSLMKGFGFRVAEVFGASFDQKTGDMTQVDILFLK